MHIKRYFLPCTLISSIIICDKHSIVSSKIDKIISLKILAYKNFTGWLQLRMRLGKPIDLKKTLSGVFSTSLKLLFVNSHFYDFAKQLLISRFSHTSSQCHNFLAKLNFLVLKISSLIC